MKTFATFLTSIKPYPILYLRSCQNSHVQIILHLWCNLHVIILQIIIPVRFIFTFQMSSGFIIHWKLFHGKVFHYRHLVQAREAGAACTSANDAIIGPDLMAHYLPPWAQEHFSSLTSSLFSHWQGVLLPSGLCTKAPFSKWLTLSAPLGSDVIFPSH